MERLVERFPNARGFKTEKFAQSVLDRARGLVDEDERAILTVVIQRPTDSRWLPVVIFGAGQHVNIPALCARGICVTNV
jgi:hypothetical protein